MTGFQSISKEKYIFKDKCFYYTTAWWIENYEVTDQDVAMNLIILSPGPQVQYNHLCLIPVQSLNTSRRQI